MNWCIKKCKKIWIIERLSLSLFHTKTKTKEIMAKEIKKVWGELISLYDIADQLEDNGKVWEYF